MAKQGQHKHDHNDPRVSRGPNYPKESVTITTGTYKKPTTYRAQYAAHQDPNRAPQRDEHAWHEDTNEIDPVTHRDDVGDQRTGSDSNADTGTRGY
jgi:hypothetical protein